MLKGTKHTKESRKRISEGHKGQTPWNKGKYGYSMPPASEERKMKISIALTKNNGQRGKPAWNSGMIGYNEKEKHWHWKGGITPKNVLIRNSFEGKEWRKNVFKRDDFKCQMPGCLSKRGCYLIAHHIKKFADFPDLRFEIKNGITLCKNCDTRVYRKEKEFEDLFLKILNTKYYA